MSINNHICAYTYSNNNQIQYTYVYMHAYTRLSELLDDGPAPLRFDILRTLSTMLNQTHACIYTPKRTP